MHQLTMNELGRAEMAYQGNVPWHGLGQQVSPDASIDDWRRAAGLNWSVVRRPVQYTGATDEEILSFPTHHVLYRDDNLKALSVVRDRYKIVQPEQILEFFRDLISGVGFKIETAGSLDEGRKIWVLANTGLQEEIVAGDRVKGYLLLATSYDGQMATTGTYTSTRVVCNNTLQMALARDSAQAVKVRHNTEFLPDVVKAELGLMATEAWGQFVTRMQTLSKVRLSDVSAREALARVMTARSSIVSKGDVTETRGFKKVMQLFQGDGRGSNMAGVRGTAWGLVNAVTQFVDFERKAQSTETRLNSAWFGSGANLKDDAVKTLLEMA